MIVEIKTPQVNVNDVCVVLAGTYVRDGDHVREGEALCSLETSKAVIDLDATRSGYVRFSGYRVGDEIPVQETVCYIADKKEELAGLERKRSVPPPAGGDVRMTEKAKECAARLGVDPSRIARRGIIREKDILKAGGVASAGDPAPVRRQEDEGVVSPDFLARIADDKDFAGYPSQEKIAAYRDHGARIGRDVVLEPGAVLVSKRVVIGDQVRIRRGTVIECDELFIGEHGSIGKDCELCTGIIDFGPFITVADKVCFDMSGGKTGSSRVVTGQQCLIARECYLNASRSIVLGDNVALSPRVMIYTHSYWQSVLEGYFASFQDVFIHDWAWVGAGAQVLPGVQIGKGSVVMSNSTVAGKVDAETLVGGVPAGVLKTEIRKVLPLGVKIKKMVQVLGEFRDYLEFRGCRVTDDETSQQYQLKVDHRGRAVDIVLAKGRRVAGGSPEMIVLAFGDVKTAAKAVFDLENMRFSGEQDVYVKELRNFLRRYGILFQPPAPKFSPREGLESMT